ncbi:Protein saf4 [Tilletia horrida]|nr:Protein saf4 [Tilletia horrida]
MQGFNMGRYRPPEDDPSKTSWNKSHPLGKRAHKLDQGILVVRFELPFNIWCGSCDTPIGQGVRFNAEKKKVGNYLSTPIYAFRCKCTTCKNYFEIQTDPKNTRYLVTEGARAKDEEWDPEENGGFAAYETEPSTSSQPPDAFSQLEKTNTQVARAKSAQERILELEAHSSARSYDPYALNFRLRSSFRVEKKEREGQERKDEALRRKMGWNSDRKLLPENESDAEAARLAWAKEKDAAAQRRVEEGKMDATHTSSDLSLVRNSLPDPNVKASSSSSRKARSSVQNHSRSSGGGTKDASKASASHRKALPLSSKLAKTPKALALAARVINNTKRKLDPFNTS